MRKICHLFGSSAVRANLCRGGVVLSGARWNHDFYCRRDSLGQIVTCGRITILSLIQSCYLFGSLQERENEIIMPLTSEFCLRRSSIHRPCRNNRISFPLQAKHLVCCLSVTYNSSTYRMFDQILVKLAWSELNFSFFYLDWLDLGKFF